MKQAKKKKENILGGENEIDKGMETEVMIGFSENDSTSDFMMMEWKVGNKMSRLLNSLTVTEHLFGAWVSTRYMGYSERTR